MVWGFQYDNSILTSFIGAEAKEPLLAKILDVYAGRRFPELQNDMQNMTSNPVVTKILMKLYPEFRMNGKQQELASGILVYPRDYFTYASRNRSANYMEHLFDNSWGSANLGFVGDSSISLRHSFHICGQTFPLEEALRVRKEMVFLTNADF